MSMINEETLSWVNAQADLKVKKGQRTGFDTIKYHTWPETPYGKVTKTQETSHSREPRGQPFASR